MSFVRSLVVKVLFSAHINSAKRLCGIPGPRHILICCTLSLALVLNGCGGGSSDGSGNGVSTLDDAGGQLNGQLTGHLWTTGVRSYRFNLQTGRNTQIGSGEVFPSRDGRKYVDYMDEVDYLEPPSGACLINVARPLNRVEVRDTITGELYSSFQTTYQIYPPIKLSPDGTRLLANAAPVEQCSRTTGTFTTALTVFSLDGNILYRGSEDIHQSAFEWLPNGAITLVRRERDSYYSVEFERVAGSYSFDRFAGLSDNPGSVKRVGSLRVNATGNQMLLEVITDESGIFSTVFTRKSEVLSLNLNSEAVAVTDVFISNESDGGDLRANGVVFSPDGNWILTTHAFSGGVVVLGNNEGDGSPGFFTDTALIAAPPTGVSYVVPSNTANQPLPPVQITESIRPVLAIRDNQVVATGFNPKFEISWTPPLR